MFVLASKLRTLKQRIRVWNKAEFEDVNIMVEKSFDDLHIIQQEIASSGPSDDLLSRESVTSAQVHEALLLQEKFLCDKSRIKWLTECDRNFSFFHAMVKVRHLNQSLSTMRDGKSIIDDPKEISDHVMVLVEFFIMKCWSVVGADVVQDVQSFFNIGYILPHFNSNLMILIPKVPGADIVTQLRPIAMANFIFKLITKILADRLGSIATRIISPNQSVFLRGRTITDPIMLTSECINLLDRNCKGGNIAIKFDVQKAFDTLD
ncbi:uncharacterized protein LOC126786897 [Argentina anserina]|uniref:uncharacterized protein LOC126786897 n=1 Tax=Argentina anserina TaxID=57926 RepID=UPI002176481D|nr:uncharacterized protein LOC126786897 [Potentilla anserina]